MNDRDERNTYGSLTDWALAFDALSDYGCDCGDDEPGTCLACVCGRAMRTERARAEKAEAEVARLAARIEELEAGVAAGKSAALLTRIEVLERRQEGWHPIPPAPALSGHELCVHTQAGSVREATDAEILAHPAVATLLAKREVARRRTRCSRR